MTASLFSFTNTETANVSPVEQVRVEGVEEVTDTTLTNTYLQATIGSMDTTQDMIGLLDPVADSYTQTENP